jgi:hypothetical protein
MGDDSEHDAGGGYCSPPKHSQFRKGQSGNPKGRPKGSSSFKADLLAALQQKVPFIENGKQHTITTQKAVLASLTAAALQNDIKAVNVLLACIKYFGVGAEEQVSEEVETVDLDELENSLAQARKKQNRAKSDVAGDKSKK